MRLLFCAALLTLAACSTDTPREGASCDRDKWDYACHDGALFQCRPRTGIWHFMAKCEGPSGCSATKGPPGVAGSYACDALPGAQCGIGFFGPECSPDRTARLDCDHGTVTKESCPAGCDFARCKEPPGPPPDTATSAIDAPMP